MRGRHFFTRSLAPYDDEKIGSSPARSAAGIQQKAVLLRPHCGLGADGAGAVGTGAAGEAGEVAGLAAGVTGGVVGAGAGVEGLVAFTGGGVAGCGWLAAGFGGGMEKAGLVITDPVGVTVAPGVLGGAPLAVGAASAAGGGLGGSTSLVGSPAFIQPRRLALSSKNGDAGKV